jgi:hypothetical protein
LAFFHVPKTGGSALRQALLDTLKPPEMANGWDRSLFGDYDDFRSMDTGRLNYVFLTQDALPKGASFVTGHLSVSTIRLNYPDAQFITILREPTARVLSHWVFWRKRSEDDLRSDIGTFADRVELARSPLTTFLASPLVACQVDNVTARLLLWPHPLIPDGDFIPPENDEALVADAICTLDSFECVNVYENPRWFDQVSAWLGCELPNSRVNDTPSLSPTYRTNLDKELTPEACELLERRSRIDRKVWAHVARKRLSMTDLSTVQASALLSSVARFARLLQPTEKS